MLNRLEKLPGFKKYKNGEEMAIVQLFYTLQRAHNTAAEVTGHLTFLGRTLSPDQFSFILKHSVRPLIQLNIAPGLCNPGELTFMKADLTPEEAFKHQSVNKMLPKPYHPKLQKVENKHATCCLAAAVHYQLHQNFFTKCPESQGNVADMFGMKRKKFFTSIMGRTYNAGKKLMKAEKRKQETHEMELKKQKLQSQMSKVEKQQPEKEKTADQPLQGNNDDDDMLMLVSDEEDPNPGQGAIRKWFVGKKLVGPKLRHKK